MNDEYLRFHTSRGADVEVYTAIVAALMMPLGVSSVLVLLFLEVEGWPDIVACLLSGLWPTPTAMHAIVYFARRKAWW